MSDQELTIDTLQSKAVAIREHLDALDEEPGRPGFLLDVASKLCFDSNYSRGWWHNIETMEQNLDRNKPEMICLMHSEISEAWDAEGNDDKLEYRPGEEVELADAIIRIFDFCEGFDHNIVAKIAQEVDGYRSTLLHIVIERAGTSIFEVPALYNEIHKNLSAAMEAIRKNGDPTDHFAEAVLNIFCLANQNSYELWDAIFEKMQYNMRRKDHDIDQRLLVGGKKF